MNFDEISTYNHLLDAMKSLVNKIHQISNKLTFNELDARQVALGGMKKIIAGYAIGLNALIHDRNIEQVAESVRITNLSDDEARKTMEDAWRHGMVTLIHFKIDSLLYNLLVSLGKVPPRSFKRELEMLLKEVNIKRIVQASHTLLVLSHIRNSFHNNGIHRNLPFTISLKKNDI